tara:strand:- start:25 stop:291 length:267 start_codon:yes stop_codon:yes gene_type:complete
MIDELFGPSYQQVRESIICAFTQHLALVLLLTDKGIVNDDELDKFRAQATHIMDQLVAEQKEQAVKEFDKEHPGVRQMWNKTTGQEQS